MHKGEFVAGMAVRPLGSMHVMTLGGSVEEWICSWHDNDEHRAMRYMPEDLEPACMPFGDAEDDEDAADARRDAIAAASWADDALLDDALRVDIEEE